MSVESLGSQLRNAEQSAELYARFGGRKERPTRVEMLRHSQRRLRVLSLCVSTLAYPCISHSNNGFILALQGMHCSIIAVCSLLTLTV